MKAEDRVPVPPKVVVTETDTAPAEPAGVFTVSLVALLDVMVAAFVPKVTDVTVVKLVPVMVTDVPPAVGPWAGVTLVRVGAAT